MPPVLVTKTKVNYKNPFMLGAISLKLFLDPRVHFLLKSLPLLALGYWLSPVDLLPVAILPVDDLAVWTLALSFFVATSPADAVFDAVNGVEHNVTAIEAKNSQ